MSRIKSRKENFTSIFKKNEEAPIVKIVHGRNTRKIHKCIIISGMNKGFNIMLKELTILWIID